MEFTKCQMSYDFVQPKLLEWPARSNACNYSHALPSDVGQDWIPSGCDLDLTESNNIIQSALKHQTASRAQSKPQPRRLRRQAMGLDQVKAAPRPSFSSMDSFRSTNQSQDTPLGQLLDATERQLSLRGSFRVPSGSFQAQPPPLTSEVAEQASSMPSEAQPGGQSAPLPVSTNSSALPSESQTIPPPAAAPKPTSKTLAKLRITEALSCVEKQGAVKLEISGSAQLQEAPSTGSYSIELRDVANSGWVSKEVCEGATLQSGKLQLDFSRLHPGKLFAYACQPTFQPQLLKAKNAVSSLADAKALQIVVQLALNPRFSHPLENLTVQVSIAAMLQKLAAKGEAVGKITPTEGDGGYNAARKMITWTLVRPVHPAAERKVTFSAEVTLEEMDGQVPASIPMVVKAQYGDALLSGVSADDAGVGIEVASSTQMEWKYL